MVRKLFLFVLLFPFLALAQREISDYDIKQINTLVEKQAQKFRDSLEANNDSYYSKNEIDFKIDTYKVDRMIDELIEIDYSTAGMNSAMHKGHEKYDNLLNKYYKILSKKLDDEDKIALKKTQLNWIKFRDSEREFNYIMTYDKYSGGGTIQSNIRVSKYLEITKVRLQEIFNYLNRIE